MCYLLEIQTSRAERCHIIDLKLYSFLFSLKNHLKFPIIMSLTLNHYNVNIIYSVACKAIKLNSSTEMCEIFSIFNENFIRKVLIIHFPDSWSKMFDSKDIILPPTPII